MSSISKFLIFIFIVIFFVPCLCEDDTNINVASCLIQQNINNFTIYSNPNNGTSNHYFDLLNFSIQNLRFSATSVPKPVAIILPETKQELASSVFCCRLSSLEIRIRCGGHSYEGTSSVATDGRAFVIIDMMNLDRVIVDPRPDFAWVEGGATLGQTYYAIAESSDVRGFPAGSCPTVGSGGHIAGGGFGLISRKYGLAADNVVDVLLVDAEGQLLDREAMGEDVFWAIRGGGGGIWGIVYAWKIKLSRVPKTVTAFTVSRPGTSRDVAYLVDKWQHVAPKLDDEFYLSSFVGAGLPQRKGVIGISATFKGFYLGPKTRTLSIISKQFPELGITEGDCKEMSWIESVVYFSGLDDGSSVLDLKNRYLKVKGYFKAKSDYVRTPIPVSGIKEALRILEKEPKGYVILDPYGGIMNRINSESIAFPHRKGNLFTIQYLVEWGEVDNSKSTDYIDWIQGFYNSMKPYVSSGPRAAYVNYIDLDLGVFELISSKTATLSDAVERARVWGEQYFLKNYDRLVQAKTTIDPNNVFRNQQGIPPMPTAVNFKENV
ncbi:berberine bridge enzyme-like D-2 [Apium graveolens]|uniref:berberine bridge enzyme-like D-2 n=1 Tax=Apium graveolens TaxID=4045 RepID=UPI003D7A3FE1